LLFKIALLLDPSFPEVLTERKKLKKKD